MCGKRCGVHAEHLDLRFVGIGDEAAVDDGGRACDSVKAPAIRPPVQDSAVASLSPREVKSWIMARAFSSVSVVHIGLAP